MKVLIADDEAVTRQTLSGLIAHLGHEPSEAQNGVEAWDKMLARDAAPMVILDWMMPGMTGIQICEALRLSGKRPYQYVLMLSSRDTIEDIEHGIDAGADDYLGKPFDMRELRVRVRAAERMLLELDYSRALAATDDLTKVLNRRGFLERLEHELSLVARDARDLSVMMIDVDHFKAVNDVHGHATGDAVLKELTTRIGAQLRSYDDVGRLGGEEFAVLLPACAGDDALEVAERIRASIAHDAISTPAGIVPITVSIGVMSVDALAEYHPTSVLEKADEALYDAKRAGRNRVQIARIAFPGGVTRECSI